MTSGDLPLPARNDDDFITVEECYKQLRIGRRQMYELLKSGRGPRHRKFGQRYKIMYKNFIKWATTPPRKGNGHA